MRMREKVALFSDALLVTRVFVYIGSCVVMFHYFIYYILLE